jgi:hypothetical protein
MTTLAAAGLVGGTLSGCGAGHEAGPPPSTPARTLDAFVAGWDHRSWPTMAGQVDDPPADFAPYNATVLTDLGATAVAVRPGIITRATTGTTASAPVTERYTVAGGVVGTEPVELLGRDRSDGADDIVRQSGRHRRRRRIGDKLGAPDGVQR